HMDAAADHGAALAGSGESGRDERADRREDQRRIERLGCRHRRWAGPFGAEPSREILCRDIAGAGKGEDPAALVPGALRHDMGGGAKTVESYKTRVPGHPQAAVADQPGAEQRRRLDITVGRIDGKAIALVGDGQFSIAAVQLIAGEAGPIAKVLLP